MILEIPISMSVVIFSPFLVDSPPSWGLTLRATSDEVVQIFYREDLSRRIFDVSD